jgi:AFG3 family protein
MNSVFKIKKNAGSVSKKSASQLIGNFCKYSFLTKNRKNLNKFTNHYNFVNPSMISLSKNQMTISIHSQMNSLNLYKYNKYNFCNKNEPTKKGEEKDDKDKQDAPKGFEKFYKRNKATTESKEDTSKKETKSDNSDKTENKDSSKNEDKEFEEENKDENSENNKNKKPDDDNFYEKLKQFANENSGLIISAVAVFAYILLYLARTKKASLREVTVNEFNTFVETHLIQSIEITKDKISPTFFNVISYLKDGNIIKLNIINHEMFLRGLEQKQYEMGIPEKDFVPIKITSTPSVETSDDNTLLPAFAFGVLAALLYRLTKNYQAFMTAAKNLKKGKKSSGSEDQGKSGLGGFRGFNMFDYGKTNVKEFGTEIKVNVKFKNVAGMEQAKKEIMEFVDFLKHPEKYHKLGAKIPRGALLAGPPGTGKTMLAKAVAGEANVPFFAISGSDFVEMFVGVGAARVRDLFKKAKEKSPSIIFIDEIDAVGRKRGGKFTGGHDERDNTLNQLLVEMDGFGTESNVIVLAATNRSDILDAALLRPGRFDRQVEITLPDRKDREQIFKIYLKKVKLDHSKSIEEYAMRLSTLTPGFSGADISNLVNEAAIISARNNKEHVDSESFESAADRIIAGLETRRMLSEKERKIVAYHEAGHAVVGWFLEHSSPLVKLTIIPRSKGALGFTQFVPDDISLRSTEHLQDLICGLLGGRIAEEKFFGSITTGASDDLQKIGRIADAMVTKYGMSNLGLRAFPGGDEEGYMAKPYSTETESVS